MAERYIIEGDTLFGIAEAIRAKRDTTTPIKPEDMAMEIGLIQSGGGGGGDIVTRPITFNCTYNNGEGVIYVDGNGEIAIEMLNMVKPYTLDVSDVSPVLFFGTQTHNVTYIKSSDMLHPITMSADLKNNIQDLVNSKMNQTYTLYTTVKVMMPASFYPEGTTFAFENY